MNYLNILICGSTRSGKSMAELRRLVEAAEAGAALVVIDPHSNSLAARLFEHLTSRGMRRRILFDRLSALDRVIGYDFLPQPLARASYERIMEVDALIRSFCDILCRRRQIESIATAALTEEWIIPALRLYVEQDDHPPLPIIKHAFGPPHHAGFRRLLEHCHDEDVLLKFRDIESGKVNRSQFVAAERLIRGVCDSPAFAARCGASFALPSFLDRRGILIVEGGGDVSDDAQRTIMGAIILLTIRYIRTRERPAPPVFLVLDEATNAGLIGASGYEAKAAAECQKMGLSIHTLVQSLNFPTAEITEAMLTNCLRHEWFFAANEAVIKRAARDLGSKNYEQDLRELKPGERMVKDRNRVFREYVPLLEDPWTYPGLSRKKAEAALAEIKQRPEYRSPVLVDGQILDKKPIELPPPPLPPAPSTDEPNPNLGI